MSTVQSSSILVIPLGRPMMMMMVDKSAFRPPNYDGTRSQLSSRTIFTRTNYRRDTYIRFGQRSNAHSRHRNRPRLGRPMMMMVDKSGFRPPNYDGTRSRRSLRTIFTRTNHRLDTYIRFGPDITVQSRNIIRPSRDPATSHSARCAGNFPSMELYIQYSCSLSST